MTEERYKALVPVRYLQILILFTKMTNTKNSWKKTQKSLGEKKKEKKG